jgi:hypothetical protein
MQRLQACPGLVAAADLGCKFSRLLIALDERAMNFLLLGTSR